jgi:uncharacterized phage-associated protein
MAVRSRSVANELIRLAKESGRSLTPLQIIKLVYIAHGWMLAIYKKPLVSDRIEAWQYGPVLPDLYQSMKQYGGGSITGEVPHGNADELDAQQKLLAKQLFDIYAKFNGIQLSELTHQSGTPWHQTWAAAGKNSPISNDLIAEHYRQLWHERTAKKS